MEILKLFKHVFASVAHSCLELPNLWDEVGAVIGAEKKHAVWCTALYWYAVNPGINMFEQYNALQSHPAELCQPFENMTWHYDIILRI